MTRSRRKVSQLLFGRKYWMGSTHFLTKRLVHVGTEMSLHVLAYNLRRVTAILGKKRMKAVRAGGGVSLFAALQRAHRVAGLQIRSRPVLNAAEN